MAYYPVIRKMCIEITRRDNRSAHERFSKMSLQDGAYVVCRAAEIDSYGDMDWGMMWDNCMKYPGVYANDIRVIEAIIGESW